MPIPQNNIPNRARSVLGANGVVYYPGTGAGNLLVLDNDGKVANANLNVDVANGVAGLDGNGDLVRAIKIITGTAAALAGYVPASGQPVYATDTKKLSIGNGVTAFASLSVVGGNLVYDPTIPAWYIDTSSTNQRGQNALDLNTNGGGAAIQGAMGVNSMAAVSGWAASPNSVAVAGGSTGNFFAFGFTVSGNNLVIAGDATGTGDWNAANHILMVYNLAGGGSMPKSAQLTTTGAATFAGGNTTIPVSSVAALGGATSGSVFDINGRAGGFCFAAGPSSTAAGTGAIAGGFRCWSLNTGATSFGWNNVTWNTYGTTLGFTNASYASGAVAAGQSNQSAGQSGVALGQTNFAGIFAVSEGNSNMAGASYSYAGGQSNQVGMQANVSWSIISATQLQVTGDYSKEINVNDSLIGFNFQGGIKQTLFQTTIGVTAIDYNVTAAGKTTITTSNSLSDRTSCLLINTSGPQNARATGFGALARRYGERVHAQGFRVRAGDIQAHDVLLYGQQAGTAPFELTLDGFPATDKVSQNSCNRFKLQAPWGSAAKRQIIYDVMVLSKGSTGTNVGAWRGTIVVYIDSGTITIVSNTIAAINNQPAGSIVTITGDSAHNVLQFVVVPGTAADTLWCARLTGIEMTY